MERLTRNEWRPAVHRAQANDHIWVVALVTTKPEMDEPLRTCRMITK